MQERLCSEKKAEQALLEIGDDKQPEDIIFPMPVDHTDDYERAREMYTMSIDDVIELTENEFDQLVLDNWGWKGEFLRTTSAYK